MEHGFDQVTIDEIAEAADVGRMTVFNHFPRKEDMFFDREDEVREMVFAAIQGREREIEPGHGTAIARSAVSRTGTRSPTAFRCDPEVRWRRRWPARR